MKAEDAKCEHTHHKEPSDLKSILKQQQGKKKMAGMQLTRKHRHYWCKTLTVHYCDFNQSHSFGIHASRVKNKNNWIFSVCGVKWQPKGNKSGNSRGGQIKVGWKYFLKKYTSRFFLHLFILFSSIDTQQKLEKWDGVSQTLDVDNILTLL